MEAEEEFLKSYKAKLIFKYLATGKKIQRKNLFKILFYLAGQRDALLRINASSSSTTNMRRGKDRNIELKLCRNFYSVNDALKTTFNKYLVNWISEPNKYDLHSMKVFYNSEDVKWHLIDHELTTNHSPNIIIKNGFPHLLKHAK